MEKCRFKIKTVGQKYGIDPALIAAIISRESRAGNALDNGWGDGGNAWGLMQVDIYKSGHTAVGAWDREEHLDQATGILSAEKQLKGLLKDQHSSALFILCFTLFSSLFVSARGIAAYNMGSKNVHSYGTVDAETTGQDYSNDVVARAQWYKRNKHY
ncbi:lysozyme g-like [Symphorus nematophorus]